MKVETRCPTCSKEFQCEEWENGVCPHCNDDYYWDEIIMDDGDSWNFLVAGNFSNLFNK